MAPQLKTDCPALWVTRNWRAKPGEPWRRMSPTTMRGMIRDACKAVGVKGNCSRFRDTVFTRIAQGPNSDILDAQYQAGHKKIDTTRRKYVRHTPEDVRQRTRASQPDFYQKPGGTE